MSLFRARWYDSNTGRWISKDPLGLEPDSNPDRYLANAPTNGVDPSGLWSVKRGKGKTAVAIAERGRDTIKKLGEVIGLGTEEWEWRKWLRLPSNKTPQGYGRIRVKAGGQERLVLLHQLKLRDVIKPGQRVEIPNTIYYLWGGDGGRFGRAYVWFHLQEDYLRNLGFNVQVYIAKDGEDQTNTVRDQIALLSGSRQLQGLYVYGHGNETAFGTDDDRLSVNYLDLKKRLAYGMGFVMMNVCDGYEGKVLVSSSSNAKFFGGPTFLIPRINSKSAWSLIDPGEQGTIRRKRR
jgi:hypothetical protein